MRPVRAVGLYLVFVFVGGALMAPGLFSLIQGASEFLPWLQSAASKPFPRYVSRALLILAIVGLPTFLRAAGLCSWRELGLSRRPGDVAQVFSGFTLGLISLAAIVALALAFGARKVSQDHQAMEVAGHFLKAGLTAVLVAPIEEIFFRGALFGSLRRMFHWSFALLMSSAVYALLHFLERAAPVGAVRWYSGFVALGGMVAGFGDPAKLIPGFLNLTLVGVILGLAYQRTGSLHYSIGLHAGWIFWLKTYGFVTDEAEPSRIWLFGTNKLINGWLAFLMLALVLIWMHRRMSQLDPLSGWKEKRLLR